MKVTSEYLSALESNFGGKYFFRIPVVQRRLNVASINEGATCETSSDYNKNYGCRNALDGQKTTNSPEWATFRQDVGAWINISLSAARLVTNINLYRRSNNRKEDASRVNVYFSNGGIEGIETPFCSSENGNNILAELDIDPVITDYVITVIADACQETVNVGFREVEIYALV
ncbi:hypothetical protein LSH36_60g02034 [Paralvinella palmiformis]|uniref:DUF7402 domain-containing protein n=1 Tax=Paralvinella palmiformis TaxID=53620 RepID=A0AAD9K4C6_9ANNE|nr:hypothetical protein LSH36_60g02034 [Paralvinella palmiformis]